MKYRKLCIFAQHRTYTFLNVTVLSDNEYALVFEYKAVSDGLSKTHTVLKEAIVGWSTTEEPWVAAAIAPPTPQAQSEDVTRQIKKQHRRLSKHK